MSGQEVGRIPIQSFEIIDTDVWKSKDTSETVATGDVLELRLHGSGFSAEMLLGLSTNPVSTQNLQCKNIDNVYRPSTVSRDHTTASFVVTVPSVDEDKADLYFCVNGGTKGSKFGEVKWNRIAEISSRWGEMLSLDLTFR